MLLGDLMSRFDDEATAEETALAIGDIVLLNALREAAGGAGLGVGEYMVAATRLFSTEASDDEWLSLMSALGRTDDPARATLERMVRWSIARGALTEGEAR
jgi:hypothetical protein